MVSLLCWQQRTWTLKLQALPSRARLSTELEVDTRDAERVRITLWEADVLGNQRKRRRRKVDPEKERHWRNLLKRFQKSGQPFKTFCASENISPNTFQYWRRELRRRDEEQGRISAISKGDNRPTRLHEQIRHWTRIIEEIKAYSGSVRSFCETRGISSGNLHYWKKRLKDMKLLDGSPQSTKRPAHVNFVPVRVTNSDEERKREGRRAESNQIEIILSDGTAIAASPEISVDTLLKLVNGLRTG